MSTSEIKMLTRRVDRLEHRMDDWDKLAHGIEDTITLILQEQQTMKSNIFLLRNDVSGLCCL